MNGLEALRALWPEMDDLARSGAAAVCRDCGKGPPCWGCAVRPIRESDPGGNPPGDLPYPSIDQIFALCSLCPNADAWVRQDLHGPRHVIRRKGPEEKCASCPVEIAAKKNPSYALY